MRKARRSTARNGRAKKTVKGLEDVIESRPPADLPELFHFWGEGRTASLPSREDEIRARVAEWMSDPAWVQNRVATLGRRMRAVLEAMLSSPSHGRSWQELVQTRSLSYLSAYDLEACLSALQRRALVVEGADGRFEAYGERTFQVPERVARDLLKHRSERASGVFEILTLRGHLEGLYADPQRAKRTTPQRLREMYKMYSRESAAVARIERLPEGIRGLVEKAILEFGGILPRQLFERLETQLPHWNGRRWAMLLEESLVGTVKHADLSRYGIQHADETLIVFNEVALAWLRRVAVPGDPDRPDEELSLGIDLISNLSRFLSYIQEHDVRFTVRGEIFKTTEKKILQHLIPNPGRELSREEVLSFLFRFARHQELIKSTGERTFAITSAGRAWGETKLADKLGTLVDFATEERGLGGEYYHQVRMRQILVRLLKRVEPGTWYDLMYLPFLARNTYLSTLDDLEVDAYFAERSQSSQHVPMEDPQRMAWNLVRWMRQRLYLCGVIDLGYNASKRPVAIRLTHSGARLLGVPSNVSQPSGGVGSIVVTPDFEVVLFPTGDDAELVHELDRFCVREKLEEVLHFRITEASVRRALKEGMYMERIHETLQSASRTPVPQNVVFSIRDWAQRAGLMTLDRSWVLTCPDAETLRRFLQDPGVRKHVKSVEGEQRVQLVTRYTPKRMQALLRDLDYLVELQGKR